MDHSTIEVWKPIPGSDGAYEASNLGNVRSLSRTVVSKDGRSTFRRGKVLSKSVATNGYWVVGAKINGKKNAQLVHRLVLLAFYGDPGDGFVACHNDGDRLNVNLDNLRWDTQSSNMYDVTRHGRNKNALKTHCPKNHEYTTENATITNRGFRRCKICDHSHKQKYRSRNVHTTI